MRGKLLRYRIDFSGLNPDAKDKLFYKLENWTFNGFFIDPHRKIGEFYVYEDFNISLLEIPDSCHLTRIDQ